MKIMLTSFGITEQHIPAPEQRMFYRMPPVSMRWPNNYFMPDYAALLLFDKIIMDSVSFGLLEDDPHPVYSDVRDTIVMLYKEGFIELVDFTSILIERKGTLQKMIEFDKSMYKQWVTPVEEAIGIWSKFVYSSLQPIQDELLLSRLLGVEEDLKEREIARASIIHDTRNLLSIHKIDLLRIKRGLVDSSESVTEAMEPYLSYVNANIVLSNELGVGFHDWADFAPLYKQKFLPVGYEKTAAQEKIEASRSLFDVSFPELSVTNPKTLIKLLRDKRIENLRSLIDDVVEGKTTFDQVFAKRVLWEVLQTEKRTSRVRNIISYLTLPLDFLPWIGTIAQLAASEGVGFAAERKLKQKYRWFYLLSDAAEKSRELP